MNDRLLIFGAGDYAELVHHYFARDPRYREIAFAVDGERLAADRFCGAPLLAFEEARHRCPPEAWDMFVAIGYTGVNEGRRSKVDAAKALGYTLTSYVHASALLADDAVVQENSFVAEQVLIKPFCRLGRDLQLAAQCYISHGARVGDHCYLAPRALLCGLTDVGECCFIGANATVRDKVRIGARCVIGAGAVILSDCEPDGVYRATPTARHRVSSGAMRRL